MFVFPSAESVTSLRTQPWSVIGLSLVSIASYFLVVLPLEGSLKADRLAREKVFFDILAEEYRQDNLKRDFYLQAQENPQVVGAPENREIFGQRIVEAYQDYRRIPKPLEYLERGSPLKRLMLVLTPHSLGILLLGAVCLILLGYIFEHCYDRMLVLVYFALSGSSWLILEPYLLDKLRPSPIFAWANTVAVLLLLFWLNAPKATLTVTFRLWPGRTVIAKPEFPGILVLAAYVAGYYYFGVYRSPYQDQFSATSLIFIPIQALVLGVPLLFVSSQKRNGGETREASVNLKLAEAESLFSEDRSRDALEILGHLMERNPSKDQMMRIADMAWRNHDNELAERGYNLLLREAFKSQDFIQVLALVEEMLHRNIQIPGSSLHSVAVNGVKFNHLDEVRRMLPHIRTHPEMDPDTVLQIHSELAKRLCARPNPDRDVLYDIKSWLEANHPEAKSLDRLNRFFNRTAANTAELKDHYSHGTVHKQVDIDLLGVTNTDLHLRVRDSREQRVPWTAILGIFGCHLATSQRGYKGCILIKFKRKVFACSFTSGNILIPGPDNQPLTFEKAWELLEQNLPEDLPFTPMRKFSDVNKEGQYTAMLHGFITKNHL